jgi:ADP-ribose pyrophosphatase YjhB (NUDIX family)
LHSGESYEEAADRRLHEELGLQLPLKRYAVTKMQDGQSTKFIGLYLAWLPRPEPPEIREPKHIEALRFWTGHDLDRTLETSPETFTETFRHLYGLYAVTGPDGTALH